jgi:HK97 gp10 family phage protein
MLINGEFNISVKTTNLDGLVSRFDNARSKIRREVKAAVGRSAARLQSRVIDICPKDTFYMSEHVRADFTPSGLVVRVGWDARDFLGTEDDKGRRRSFYPFFVEYGTRHMTGRFPLTRATREEEPLFRAELNRALQSAAR